MENTSHPVTAGVYCPPFGDTGSEPMWCPCTGPVRLLPLSSCADLAQSRRWPGHLGAALAGVAWLCPDFGSQPRPRSSCSIHSSYQQEGRPRRPGSRLHQAGAHALLSTSQVRCTCSVSFSPCPHSSPPALRSFTSCECVSTRTPATCLVLGHLRTSRLWGSFLTSSMYPSCFPCPLCGGHTAVKTFYMSQLLNGTPEICVRHTALMQWIPS